MKPESIITNGFVKKRLPAEWIAEGNECLDTGRNVRNRNLPYAARLCRDGRSQTDQTFLTIYPGEKFFDGQLVAIEENRLVFRKVIKMSNGKFISSVENKALRQYSVQATVQGTAPIVAPSATTEAATTENATTETPVKTDNKDKTVIPSVIISPVDEMNEQPPWTPKMPPRRQPAKKVKNLPRIKSRNS